MNVEPIDVCSYFCLGQRYADAGDEVAVLHDGIDGVLCKLKYGYMHCITTVMQESISIRSCLQVASLLLTLY